MAKKKVNTWKLPDLNAPVKYCIACNGSGYYDVNGSPKCGACNGTGLNTKI